MSSRKPCERLKYMPANHSTGRVAPTSMRLTVTDTFAIADLGTVAFVGREPIPLVFGSRHRVLVTRPDGESVEALASVEAVRKDSSEFAALVFASVAAGEVVPGSSISVLEEVPDA